MKFKITEIVCNGKTYKNPTTIIVLRIWRSLGGLDKRIRKSDFLPRSIHEVFCMRFFREVVLYQRIDGTEFLWYYRKIGSGVLSMIADDLDKAGCVVKFEQ